MNKFKTPFRLGKKQNRAVLDADGHEVVVFPKGREELAEEYVNMVNNKIENNMKTKLKNFFLNLQFIFKPWYWIMNGHYSKDMDIHMNELMDKYTFTEYNYYTAYLGNIEIWVTNAPYDCIVPWRNATIDNTKRPSRLTIQRGLRKLKKDCNIKDSLITTNTKISDSLLASFVTLGIITIIWLIYPLFQYIIL